MEDGVGVVTLSSWRWFSDWITQEMLDYNNYVFRGQASARWKLESSLDRAIKQLPTNRHKETRDKHLENFKLASRGRRGKSPNKIEDDDEWWALGQHHGLATPLLDWTESPFVALYFAYEQVSTDGADYRAVWAISTTAVKRLKDAKVVVPESDENARLVSQRGLFVKCPAMTDLESAVQEIFKGDSKYARLIKIKCPNKKRTVCVRSLNRMNINHSSLFPDLYGASVDCNTKLRIKDY